MGDLDASMSIANEKENYILLDLHRRYDTPERGAFVGEGKAVQPTKLSTTLHGVAQAV
jgi:hypothetical protein